MAAHNIYKEVSTLRGTLLDSAEIYRMSIESLDSIVAEFQSLAQMVVTMAQCVACHHPLTLYIEHDEEEEDETMGGSTIMNTGSYVDDDVQLQCGCHFHWSVDLALPNWREMNTVANVLIHTGNVSWTLTQCRNALSAEDFS